MERSNTTYTTRQGLTRKRREAVNHRTRFTNQLKDLLKQDVPLFLQVCGEDLFAPLACHLLLRDPTCDDLTQADPADLRECYRSHGGWKPDMVARRLAVIRDAQPLTSDPATIQPAVVEAKMLATLLLDVGKSIREYAAMIADLFAPHEDAPIVHRVPGAGPVLAPRVLVAFGTNRARFETPPEVQNIMGVSPVKNERGHTTIIQWRAVCSKFLRQRFHEYANASIKHSLWARADYQRQRARGKGDHAAIRTLAFTWIRIMFRCWQTRQPYDELTYVRAVQRRHAPL